VPSGWGAFRIRWRHGRTLYDIQVKNPNHQDKGVAAVTLDGTRVEPHAIPLVDDGGVHTVLVTMGAPVPAEAGAR